MTDTEENVNNLFMTFKSMSKNEQDLFLEKLLGDNSLRANLIDSMIIEKRKNEPSRPFEEYLKELSEK